MNQLLCTILLNVFLVSVTFFSSCIIVGKRDIAMDMRHPYILCLLIKHIFEAHRQKQAVEYVLFCH